MDEIKAYLDNLYFCLFAGFGGFVGIYLLLRILSWALSPVGLDFGMDKVPIMANILPILIIWVVGSLVVAAVLTIRQIRTAPKDEVVFTKRKQM